MHDTPTQRRKHLAQTIAALCLALAASVAPANEPSDPYLKVKAEGVADGTGTPGRVKAIEAAESQALALAVTSLLDERYLPYAAALQNRPERYVQTSRLIESASQNGETRALVEVYLRNHELRADLAAAVFPRLHPKPRVLILVAEEVAGESFLNAAASGVAERTLIDAFKGAGFNVVDPAHLRERYTAPELLARTQAAIGSVSRFGLENHADVVVVGEVFSRMDDDQPGGNLRRVAAEATLRLVRAIDAVLLDSRKSRATVAAVSAGQGARLAVRDAATKLKNPLMVSAVLAMVGSAPARHYTMTIESPGSREFLERVQTAIEGYSGVDNVEVLRMSANEALLQFTFGGKLRGLVETLEALDHPTHRLVATRVVGKTLVFRTVAH